MDFINKKDEKYSIVQLTKDRFVDVAKLYKDVYRISASTKDFYQKFRTVYTGIENIGLTVYHNKQPVAFLGIIPCFLQDKSNIILAGQLVNGMVHPQHQHRGLFSKLSNHIFNWCQELGIKIIFGFPNQNSYVPMIKHLGWTETEKMDRFTIPIKTYWLRNLFQKEEIFAQNFTSRANNNMSNSVIQDGYIGIQRSSEYIQYKMFSGSRIIELDSARVWTKLKKELIIGDMMIKNAEKIFSDLINASTKLNLSKITFQVSKECSLHKLFSLKCEPIPSFPVLFKDFGSGLQLQKIKFTFADIDIF